MVACDVRTLFLDAAAVFGPQKGASPAQVELLRRRLERLAQLYRDEWDVDVATMIGGGAAGGLAGGLAALGARLVPGFEVVADAVQLYEQIERADLVVTGEGFVDASSFDGKVVGGVIELASDAGVPVIVVAGDATADLDRSTPIHTLVDVVGQAAALDDTISAIAETANVALGPMLREAHQ